jgi:hypothetical protein
MPFLTALGEDGCDHALGGKFGLAGGRDGTEVRRSQVVETSESDQYMPLRLRPSFLTTLRFTAHLLTLRPLDMSSTMMMPLPSSPKKENPGSGIGIDLSSAPYLASQLSSGPTVRQSLIKSRQMLRRSEQQALSADGATSEAGGKETIIFLAASARPPTRP